MLAFIVKRLVMLVVTLLVASFAVYGSLYLAPGSPIATLTGGRAPSPQVVAQLNAQYHLDDPFLVRYWHWLIAALHGDLGESIPLQQNVSTLIGQRIGVTASLVLLTSIIIVIIGVGLGIVGALSHGTIDNGVLISSTVSAAMPAFAAAVVLQFVFAVKLPWFPALGDGEGSSAPAPPHPAGPGAGRLLGGAGDAGDPGGRARGAGTRARADRHQSWPAARRHRPPSRPAQRSDPDHHGGRPHDRQPDRVVGGRRDGLRSQRTGLLSRASRCRTRTSPSCRGSASCSWSSSSWSTRSSTSPMPSSTRGSRSGARRSEHPRRRRVPHRRRSGGAGAGRHSRGGRRGDGQGASPAAQARCGGWISVGIIVFAVLLALFGPILRPFDPNQVTLSYANVGPTGGHLLGFDGAGRDLLSRLMVGARTTLLGAALVAIVAVVIGSSLAVLTAWFGGRFDTAVSSGLDVMFAFPGILLAVLAAAVFGPGLLAAGLALSMAYSPYLARVLRGAALKERAMAYIQAGEVQGFSSWWLCFRHLLPNISSLIVAQGTIFFGFAVVDLAALSFLGLGIQPPQADWGVMVSEGKTRLLQGYPLEALTAVICIVLVVSR